MISVKICTSQGGYQAVTISGHAGFADAGQDIVCAAVSALAINTANSLEILTGDQIVVRNDAGYLCLAFPGGLSEGGKLLVDSLILGLKQIRQDYGKKYLKVINQEVF
jgi:hypothetical protein